MDNRIRKWIENAAGFSLQMFPDEGVRVRVSDARTDEPKKRLLAQRVAGQNGVLVTGIPRVVKAVSSCAEAMASWELFSPLGLAEIKRLLSPDNAEYLDETYGFDFFLTERESFRPVGSQHKVTALRKKDIPPEQYNLRMSERCSSETDDFIWAFACYHEEPDITATELAPFGLRCASIAVVIWENNDDIAGFGVRTEETLQGQGYALAAVSAATQWILNQGAIAWYGAYSNNIPSLRIARRLGFSLIYQSFGA
jgi:RimJ/RimL family protein N-acetyltransferase